MRHYDKNTRNYTRIARAHAYTHTRMHAHILKLKTDIGLLGSRASKEHFKHACMHKSI